MNRLRLDGPALLTLLLLAGCSSSDTTANAGLKGNGASTGSGSTSGTDSGTGAPGSGAGDGVGGNGTGANTGSGASTGSGAGGTAGSGATAGGGTAGSIGKIPIGTTQCSDGKDNDGDGHIDAADPECTGPLDNDESSFATGIPGDNVDPKWQDCFFDGNSGAGDDGCRYSTDCLTGALAPTDKNCQVTDQCRKFCMPLTPNGCDCFGCCEVSGADGGITHISITSTCTIADVGNTDKCPTCTPSASCNNTCGHCELCLGKTTLPDDCMPPPGAGGASGAGGAGGAGGAVASGGAGGVCVAPVCDPGRQACGVDCLPSCPAGQYCLTGCCVSSVR